MLGGTAPFYSRPRVDTASSIMRRIKEGDFRFDGDAWKCVSNTAKTLCKGLLTVDPRKRISMDQLHSAPWLLQTTANVNPLMTPALLIADPTTELCIKQTYAAFHNATREGFRLFPVASSGSKLLQKRKLKQSVSTETTISSSSDRSSFGSKSSSGSSGSLTNSSAKLWGGSVNQLKPKESDVFSFKGHQVSEYLSSFPGIPVPLSSYCSPLTLPLTVQVSSFSSHTLPAPPPLLSYPPQPFPFPLGNSGVSLSIISSPVIAPSSTPSHSVLCTPECHCYGPITRSRKRKLCEGSPGSTATAVTISPSTKTPSQDLKKKCVRNETITIE